MFRKFIQNKTEIIKHLNTAISLTYWIIFWGKRFACVYEFWWKAKKQTDKKPNIKKHNTTQHNKTQQNKNLSKLNLSCPSLCEGEAWGTVSGF